MRKVFFLILFLVPYLGFSQGEIAKFNTVFKDNISFGVGLKSNGYRISYRRGYFVNIYQRNFYEIEFTQIKDPREIKFSNPYFFSSSNIYFAKVNAVNDLRVGYGRMQILTQKMDRGSVEIRFLMSGGASLAMIKPVYYVVLDKTATYEFVTKFTRDLLLQQVIEMAPFYRGLDELKFNPGSYIKLGISFEYAKKTNAISALEVGGSLSAYLLPIKIIYGNRGRHLFAALYLEYRLGRYFPTSLKRKKRLEQNE